MGIGHYIKEIGRGKDGAKALSRLQAADLLGQILDDSVSDLEVGAFCLAMRIKGETPEEMAGFLDAVHSRLNALPQLGPHPTVVIPCYNGARKLPALAPLLALLLCQQGVRVCVHGTPTENSRTTSFEVLEALGHNSHRCRSSTGWLEPGAHRSSEPRFEKAARCSPRGQSAQSRAQFGQAHESLPRVGAHCQQLHAPRICRLHGTDFQVNTSLCFLTQRH